MAEIDVVGLDDDVAEINDRLCGAAKELQIIPIVGTGGIGKTTLAQKVYDHPLVKERFPVRAWVRVSQESSVADIISNLLLSIKDVVGEEGSRTDNQTKLHRALILKKYLIVIDDMWKEKTWNEVKNHLPDAKKGSRIILTTRLVEVAACADPSKKFHEMKFMDDAQSWNLLKQQVFKGGNCPGVLESTGRKIARRCGGLPLAIVVTAGLLSEGGRTEADWEEIARNMNLITAAEDEKFTEILALSYTHLPQQNLRNCFLYMGAFPEDYEIRTSKLIKLWIAEGFAEPSVQKTPEETAAESTAEKTPEETAEEFLENLVKRNLVLVTKRKSNGGIKSCKLHDLLRDLSQMKSLEENFLLYFMGKYVLPVIFEGQTRISLTYSEHLAVIDGSTIETIICNQRCKMETLEKFRKVRILDMVKADLPAHLFEFIQLKLLALSFPTVIPPSITNLPNLETLIVYPAEQRLVGLPVEIWKMSKLRHLISSSFHPLPYPAEGTAPLENLQTFSLITNFVCSERMVRTIPNVKKLGISYSQEKLDQEYRLQNLQLLHQLEKLKLEIRSDFPFGASLNPVFPESLRNLTLSGWGLPWNELGIVGLLPNLQVLKLKHFACDGEIWETTDGEFENLEYLSIDESNLQEWSTDSSHFPRLKHLVLHRCPCLSEIPDEIGEITTLKLIHLDGRNKNLVNSAEKIKTDQQDNGNTFRVLT